MAISHVVIVRHGERLDKVNPDWTLTSPTPYDTPLSDTGVTQAVNVGKQIATRLGDNNSSSVVIHTSPFLRCVQTAAGIASSFTKNTTIRLDGVFGEWLTEDYYADYSPPPSDNHSGLYITSRQWLVGNSNGNATDASWPGLGNSGEYGESWSCMHSRFSQGMNKLVQYYASQPGRQTVIIVTHGAGFNVLLGHLANLPLMSKAGLASFAIAKAATINNGLWTITYNSNEENEDALNNNRVPNLTNSSTNSSSSSVSEMYQFSPPPTNVTLVNASSQNKISAHPSEEHLTLAFGNNAASASNSTSRSMTPTRASTLSDTQSTLSTQSNSIDDEDNDNSLLFRFGGNQM